MEADSSKKQLRRSQFAVVIVLAPLNRTFERKCLVLPFAPEALKLGRQTTSRTMAASDNGYFDSRVLSRQHAEIWAERETGRVWLKDCKSSNGTYINKIRLSAENTESEPFELKRNDELDLGIDIISNDDSKQMYHRISARVEKVSILPLHIGAQQTKQKLKSQQLVNSVNQSNGSPQSLSRSVSLETLRPVIPQQPIPSRNSEAIFGGGLENLALNYSNTTTGGMMIQDSIKNHIEFELAAKRLVSQIRAVKADTAKVKSIASLLVDIKQIALEAENRDQMDKEKSEAERRELLMKEQHLYDKLKSSSAAALKAENARLRAELKAMLSSRGMRARDMSISNGNIISNANGLPLNDKSDRASTVQALSPNDSITPSSDVSAPASLASKSPSALPELLSDPSTGVAPSHSRSSDNSSLGSESSPKVMKSLTVPSQKTTQHNIMVLIGTTCLFTLVGVLIMFFFNPPMAPTNQTPLFSNVFLNH